VGDRPSSVSMNPEPDAYRLTEVCLVLGGDIGHPALLLRRRSARARLRTRLRDVHDWHVEPFMTRTMLAALMGEIGRDTGLEVHWDGDVAVIRDLSAGTRGERRLVPGEYGLYAVGAFETVGSYDWTWAEVAPPWPGPDVDARAIVGLLTAPVPNSWPIANQIKARADIHELARSLRATDEVAVRERLCHLLGDRDLGDAALAVPALVELLREPHAGLRCEAADAIRKIAEREGCEAVLAAADGIGDYLVGALTRERDPRARAMIAGVLGALRHEPATPQLIALLGDDDWLVRREGAWSLGALRAAEAEFGLEQALMRETDDHAAEAMRSALEAITGKRVKDDSGASAPPPLPRFGGVGSTGGVRVATTADVARGLPAESSLTDRPRGHLA
jgi:hypothetical protein